MTQDQYGQARGPDYVVPDDQTEEDPTEQDKPMTRFQKVASALRGDKTDRDEADQDQTSAHPVTTSPEAATGSDVAAPAPDTPAASPPWVTQEDEAAMANNPVPPQARPQGDYWDDSHEPADQDEAVAVTSPDAADTAEGADAADRMETEDRAGTADHAATEPDVFGTTTPHPEPPPGAATIADVPAGGTLAADEAASGVGRHAAAQGADEMRPGEGAGALGDFSDLTYGNLIPDAAHYVDQWQQIQFRFVDDPHASVTEAADVIAQVTAKMEAAIQERQRAIEERQRAIAEQQRSLRDRWGEGTNADTEALRETLRMYKTFLDQLIGSRAS